MANYLNKAQVLGAEDRIFEDVEVPEWGGVVRVRSLMGAEKDAFEASVLVTKRVGKKLVQQPSYVNVRAKLVARCVVDETGQPLFSDEDVPALGRKSAAALDRVVEVAKRLNRMSEDDLDELVGDLKNDQPGALPTA